MNIMELGAVGELVGGVAVIVSLIYVGMQLRHTGKQLDDQNLNTVFQTLYDAYQPFFMGENRELVHAGLTQERELSGAESIVFDLVMSRVFCSIIPLERADRATQESSLPIVSFLIDGFPGGAAWAREARTRRTLEPSFAAYDRLRKEFSV